MIKKEEFKAVITEEITLNYLLELPENYEEKNDKKFPLLLFLHGMGERGNDLSMLYSNGIPKLITEGTKLPFITVMPQCPETSFWTEESKSLKMLLDDMIDNYNADEDRIYITGLSMGGYGTYEMLSRYPGFFAAAIPICGGIGSMYTRMNLLTLKDTPMWIFHGEKDDVVPVKESENIYETLTSKGAENLYITLYPDLRHDSWTRTYGNNEIYDFLLKHSN